MVVWLVVGGDVEPWFWFGIDAMESALPWFDLKLEW
jgi:hypothetical protein